MDIAKLKSMKPSINTDSLKGHMGAISSRLTAMSTKVNFLDFKALLKGFSVVFGFYSLVFGYVYFNSDATIQKIYAQIPRDVIQVQVAPKAKPKPAAQANNVHGDTSSGHNNSVMPSSKINRIDGLYKRTELGEWLPVIRPDDNLTSFRAYQHPFSFETLDVKKPVLSFVILDYGLSQTQSENVLDLLPPEVSLVLSPYASLPDEWVVMAQDKGHEIWMGMPIQNETDADLGGDSLFHHSGYAQKQRAMHNVMQKTQGYVGISSFTDDTTHSSEDQYTKLAEEIYARGLGFFELNPDAPSFIENRALTLGAPYVQADISVLRMKGDAHSFDTLESIAHEKGYAVAILPSYPETINNLAVWILKIAQADYTIAPVSAIYDLPLYKSQNPPSSSSQKQPVAARPTPVETPKALAPQDMAEPVEHDLLQNNEHH